MVIRVCIVIRVVFGVLMVLTLPSYGQDDISDADSCLGFECSIVGQICREGTPGADVGDYICTDELQWECYDSILDDVCEGTIVTQDPISDASIDEESKVITKDKQKVTPKEESKVIAKDKQKVIPKEESKVIAKDKQKVTPKEESEVSTKDKQETIKNDPKDQSNPLNRTQPLSSPEGIRKFIISLEKAKRGE
jgi:hypothetical protein